MAQSLVNRLITYTQKHFVSFFISYWVYVQTFFEMRSAMSNEQLTML
jgi:hypothetical protein